MNLRVGQKIYLPFKRFFDIFLSLLVIIVFSWLYLIIALLVKCTSKGPVFFKQKRIGKNKKEFYILKFRTMKVDAPKDVATHLLENPDFYITKVGKFLRKTSLDELPQVFNIFIGQMSIVGPRPALWNQFDLIEARDQNGANSIRPGLSGWAQCKGRDTLPIPEKAALDGYYIQKFNIWMDIKIIFLTAIQAFRGKDEIEGVISKNKICIVVTIPMTIEWFVDPFAKKLADKGFQIDFICDTTHPDFESKYPYARFINVSMKRGFDRETFFSVPKKMKEIFVKEKYNAVLYATPGAAYYASKAAKKANISKRIFLNWGFRYISENNIIKKAILKHFEKKTFKNSTYSLIVSRKNMDFAIKNKLVKPDKIDVVGVGGLNGVDTNITVSILNSKNEWHEYIPKNKFIFGSVARFNPDKGVKELYEAFKIVSNKHPNNNLLLIFQGPIDDINDQYKILLKQMQNDPQVMVIDRQKHIDTLKIISIFDVFVLPTYRDGFGTSLQEAMALKKPCITTNIPGPSEVIRNEIDGLLVNVKDIQDLSEKMEYLYLNQDKISEFGEAAYEYAKQYYDSGVCVRDYSDYLEKIIKQ